jgi:hypothetical protein
MNQAQPTPQAGLNPLKDGTEPLRPTSSHVQETPSSTETDPMEALWRIKDERSVRFGNAYTLLQHLRQTHTQEVHHDHGRD